MKSLTVILGLFFILSCQPPHEHSVSLTEADISAVMEATTQYGTSIINGDFDKLRSLMSSEMVLLPPEAPGQQGIDAAIQYMQGFPSMEGSISPEQVNGSGNQAVVRGTYNLRFSVNDTTQVSDNGKYIEVWEKLEDGSWKITTDIWNTSISPDM